MNEVIVEKDKIKHNLKVINNHIQNNLSSLKPAKVIGVVKLNGYGLGIVELAKYLISEGIDTLAVATTEEALILREAGIESDILMLTSTAIESEVKTLVENNIILTVGSYYTLKAVEKLSNELGRKIDVHLKLDTGFGRYGFVYRDMSHLTSVLKEDNALNILGCFSHFSNAYYDKEYTEVQFQRFVACTKKLEFEGIDLGIKHIANTSAFIKYPKMHLDAVRIGSIITGRAPFKHDLDVKRVGYLKSNVCDIKDIPERFNVGYSNTYVTDKKTLLGLIPAGTSHGVNVEPASDMLRTVDALRDLKQALKNIIKKRVLTVNINGKKINILGRIGGSHIAIDITNKNIKIGDEAILDADIKYVDSRVKRRWI